MAHARAGGAGPDLAAAPGPASKYLTFQTYLEGGEARKATLPPPPGPIGSAFPGVGGPERGSGAWTPGYSPRGCAGRRKPEGLSASHSLQAAVSRCEALPTPALQSLSFRGGRAGAWVQGARRRRPPPPGRVRHSRVPERRPAFPKSRGDAPASVSARSGPPHVFVLSGLESLLPTGFLLKSLSHINGKIGGNTGRPGNSP